MNNKDIYKAWAPTGKRWVDWVRPVPFIYLGGHLPRYNPSNMLLPFMVKWKLEHDTAVIVDMPGEKSVEAGILLAKYGFRPIPIYNGTIEQLGARATSDNDSIFSALIWGASILSSMNLAEDAPPAFLTDSNRLARRKINESVFDNSWDVYHQDLPTEEYLINHGITKILVIGGEKLSKDLKDIFNKDFPKKAKKKVAIYLTDGYDEPRLIKKGR